jgi:DNA-3-methyladenine glycosylase I
VDARVSWLREGADGVTRCWWCGDDLLYVAYHDDEWGRRVTDDTRLFEKLVLEGFQSGLSWLTILRKRENFRAAFDDFDVEKVAAYGPREIERLLGDAGIVRHRGKIESTINNAQRAIELISDEGTIGGYVAQFAMSDAERVDSTDMPIPSTTAQSIALSKDLKRRGWSFVGPTTMYAFMQAMGLVNDHLVGCSVQQACQS